MEGRIRLAYAGLLCYYILVNPTGGGLTGGLQGPILLRDLHDSKGACTPLTAASGESYRPFLLEKSMASRCLLHKSKLDHFRLWCFENKIPTRPGKGSFEVLQVYDPRLGWGVIFDRIDAKEHYTVNNNAMPTVHRYIGRRKA